MSSSALLHLHELMAFDRHQAETAILQRVNSAYLGNHTALVRVLGRYKLYVDTRDRGFGSHVLLDGFWEIWLTLFCARNVKRGMTAIDVGANFGYYSLLLAELVGTRGELIAVEPNPHAADFLRRSVELNGLLGRSRIETSALGATIAGEASLYVPHSEPKNAQIVSEMFQPRPQDGVVIKVPVTTLDGMSAACSRVDFIKIDAEGAEEVILEGMAETIARHKPMLVVEFNPARYADASGFLERLAGIYGAIRRLDFSGEAEPITSEDLLSKYGADDSLLVLSRDKPA
ncbi:MULTISPECIES: FkbM family methyltransferase [Rhizobium]|uniref:FkbM family methyltransferase n=1 Tax=Rhizobium tropici TaxID=398 RepID=A0A6P1CEN4_RHITR|nr:MULTISPECIES: FkbM family methyltransferase [Rhizobium]MBB4242180.1 FkbM family methyltransferase [Rhizobium tropici]MBB5593795.1 FkbM family methyltransferase [Rhizobium tropici]MBB6492505.1 FkbM family methyltransferase [Rhizobium tropici]NEV14816.1 FkbM family methyltransferase [Rhizobium tropici]TGE96432.1 FkbM family methyltransferase [Rhizobium sp. SEMIA 4088]